MTLHHDFATHYKNVTHLNDAYKPKYDQTKPNKITR